MPDKSLNKNDYVVRSVSIETARRIVEKFHYSGGATNTRVYIHGLFKIGEDFFDNQCLGVAWWLPPTKNAAIATYSGDWRKARFLKSGANESFRLQLTEENVALGAKGIFIGTHLALAVKDPKTAAEALSRWADKKIYYCSIYRANAEGTKWMVELPALLTFKIEFVPDE